MENKIIQGDCLEYMRHMNNNSVDLIFTDPPYALGSEVIIKYDGKPDYKKAVDFMNKWDQPDGAFWQEWFIEAKRILKFGGRVVMFGMDRQLMLNKYYACSSGLIEQQSLYWFQAGGFPKASDLSKNIDKHFGEKREKVGEGQGSSLKKLKTVETDLGSRLNNDYSDNDGTFDITAPTSDLAKKYNGMKYSIVPLKQTNETIMVFQKEYKTGSCLHDVLAYENGDNECICGALDIENNRVPMSDEDYELYAAKQESFRNSPSVGTVKEGGNQFLHGDIAVINPAEVKLNRDTGRYPSQTFIDIQAAELLDIQSGIKTSGKSKKEHTAYGDSFKFGGGISTPSNQHNDKGGTSKILHKCDYDNNDFDLYHYCPKISKSERGEGNTHPTVKPIALITKILSLFKTPNEQLILDPFAGSGTTGVVCENIGVNYILIEKDESFVDIINSRISKTKNTTINEFFDV